MVHSPSGRVLSRLLRCGGPIPSWTTDVNMTEKEKFVAWFENEKKNGLIDFRVTLNPNGSGDEESLYRDLNQVNEMIASGQEVERGDVF